MYSDLTIGELLRRDAEVFSNKTAIVDGDSSFTYAEFDAEVDAFSQALLDMGVHKGDSVAALFPNEWPIILTYFAATRIGAAIVTVNSRLLPQEVAWILQDTSCKVLVYSSEREDLVAQLVGTGALKHLVAAGDSLAPSATARLSSLLDEYRGRLPRFSWTVTGEDLSGIWYTSGTTGTPKGALVSHYSSIYSAVGTALVTRMDERSQILGVAPLFHRGAMEDFHLGGFLVGATHIMLPRFDPQKLLEMIEERHVTHAFIVPSMTWAVLGLPGRGNYDLSSMVTWMTASAPFPEQYRDRLESETTLPKGRVFNVYGTTESLINSYLPPEAANQHRGSVGWAAPGTRVRIVNENREKLPVGDVGEIALLSESMAYGYLNNREAWEAVTFAVDGRTWYLSGDTGYLNEGGALFIVDRSKDMVISGGENVYCMEVELALLRHPEVSEAAVVGVPNDRWGEMVAAMVVVMPGSGLGVEELAKFCAMELADYKRPRQFVFADALPRNSMGKMQKHQIREIIVAFEMSEGQP
jgi:acyl-CoA synthetase (AMP-forming)/AMP-acid ligase II